jgi:sugar/nucleoside kinase (ribokinase family)
MKKGVGGGSRAVDLVVVGSVGLDTVETAMSRWTERLGGSVSYACAAARLFAKTGMVGVVGTDFPATYRNLYRRIGIDIAGLQVAEGRTFRWSGVYEADMINRRTLSTELNVFAEFRPDLPASYTKAPFVLLGNIAPALQMHVLRQMRHARFVLADTMDLWIRTAGADLKKVIRRVDMLALNDSEARLLTGESNLKAAGRRILRMGPRYVVIKKGEHGALLMGEGGLAVFPAYPVDMVRDPTGAGDAFAGAFMGFLAAHGRVAPSAVREAMVAGSVVASFAVEGVGLDGLSRLTRLKVESRRRELMAMVPR